MIQVNLLPDVKQELIQARRMRATVISISILAMIVSGGIVTLLGLYVFAGQTVRDAFAQNAIESNFKDLQKTKDVSNMLTVQNQLAKISESHADKTITSRLFDMLSVIIPEAPNNVSLTSTDLNVDDGTLTLQGQSPAGYIAYEAFKKTLAATELTYYEGDSNDIISVPLASEIVDGEQNYGEDQDGNRVLRFEMTFKYNEALLSATAKRMVVKGPVRQNATDSYVAIPNSLFTAPATNEEKR